LPAASCLSSPATALFGDLALTAGPKRLCCHATDKRRLQEEHAASPAGAGGLALEENGLSSLRGIFSETRPPMRDLSDYADDADDRGDSRYSSPVYLKCLGQFMLKVWHLWSGIWHLHSSPV
jgi:hypothetical protein